MNPNSPLYSYPYKDRVNYAMIMLHLREVMEIPFPRDVKFVQSYMWRLRYHNQLLPEFLPEKLLLDIERRGVAAFVEALHTLTSLIDLGDPILSREDKRLFIGLISAKLQLKWEMS